MRLSQVVPRSLFLLGSFFMSFLSLGFSLLNYGLVFSGGLLMLLRVIVRSVLYK
jgi:hypothetical protein